MYNLPVRARYILRERTYACGTRFSMNLRFAFSRLERASEVFPSPATHDEPTIATH